MTTLNIGIDALPSNIRAKAVTGTDCWLWTGAVNSKGYPTVGNRKGSSMLVHRSIYEQVVGPIPDGLTIDHLCRVKLCINPAHLEPVTRAENNRRARSLDGLTHCSKGHELTAETLYEITTRHGYKRRECRLCRATQARRRHERAGVS